jgi:hypothetical protein
VGRDAIRALWEKVLATAPHFEQEVLLPTLMVGDIALTSTPAKDGAGASASGPSPERRLVAAKPRPTRVQDSRQSLGSC